MKFHLKSAERLLNVLSCLALVGCASTAGSPDEVLAGAGLSGQDAILDSIQDYVLVDCLLPGQIRRLGTSMTYLSPRRAIKTTQKDCGIRGGEYVLFDRSDYSSALQTLLPKARAGDAIAQTYVAEIYEQALGLPSPDYSAAASWYQKAAAQGYRPAQISLGSLYERGLGVTTDKAAALNLYRKAAGLDQDRLMFESALKAEREAYQREIALRNRVAASLRQQLTAATMQAQAASNEEVAAKVKRLESQIVSNKRDVEAQARRLETELSVMERLPSAGTADNAPASQKKAQVGKLKLTSREQLLQEKLEGYRDTSRRLAASN